MTHTQTHRQTDKQTDTLFLGIPNVKGASRNNYIDSDVQIFLAKKMSFEKTYFFQKQSGLD